MRLIDADALIDRLDERKKMEQGVRNIADILNIQAFIDSQPTAYDIDKVVEELQCDECQNCDFFEVCAASRYCEECHKKIIEIVKQGGVADDVCEWKLTDTGKLMPYKTSCGNEDLYDNHYKYCPYCGKKIKAVE